LLKDEDALALGIKAGGALMSDGMTEAYRGIYFESDHRSASFNSVSKPLTKEEKSMSKFTKSRTVTFTRASETDVGVTVTAKRLAEAGFKINADKVLKGQRFRATLTDTRGNSVNVVLTVNRSKANGGSYTTLYTYIEANSFSLPYVGLSREYSVSNFRAV
jgi:hypothetical protein